MAVHGRDPMCGEDDSSNTCILLETGVIVGKVLRFRCADVVSVASPGRISGSTRPVGLPAGYAGPIFLVSTSIKE